MDQPVDPNPEPAPSTTKSPGGEEFDVLGRAGPLRLRSAPGVSAEARQDLLVIKEGALFLCSRPSGDILPGLVSGEGLYTEDTRFLSEFRLLLGGKSPVLLSSNADLAYAMVIDSTNPSLTEGKVVKVPQQTLSIQRFRLLADRLYERISLRNYSTSAVGSTLQLSLAADYADTFEVRGVLKRRKRGQALAPKVGRPGLRFGYVGEDEVFRETLVAFDPAPTELTVKGDVAVVSWDFKLAPAEKTSIEVTVEPSIGGSTRPAAGLEAAEKRVEAAYRDWHASGAAISSDNEHFNGFVESAIRDLKALETPIAGSALFAAGIPWYVAPFGRDSLLTSLEAMVWNPATAVGCLKVMAGWQATEDDPWRDAEPGKIPHELRQGELAGAGLIPHTPYYGTVDATPLFLMLAGAYFRWTGDIALMKQLRPNFDAALRWMRDYGDRDGDGFVEYEQRGHAGLRNQGWKDSEDCIVHADGSLAQGSIALVEVQGYVYLAKLRIAEVYAALGAAGIAERLRQEAGQLKQAFDAAFWMPEEGTFALALDGKKRQVEGVASNVGHALYCGIVDPRRAAAVGERLMARDMFSGWGVRTLSKKNPAYNPMGYHVGSVWPHDNVIVAAGLKRYGLVDATERIATAMFDAAVFSDLRLDELYCGFDRRSGLPPVDYPVACSPQAWAAAVPLMLTQTFLGISAQAPAGALTVNQPKLPPWLNRVDVDNLTVGGSKVSMEFTRHGDQTAFALTKREGNIRVTIDN
ncbi:MAG TPA: glycogen debranching N-terminal domain-containing protein [Actinomycetota bacterium]|nr:glycogen debranching N-terminal domain-containing protein [Actinomycetota bacterium]